MQRAWIEDDYTPSWIDVVERPTIATIEEAEPIQGFIGFVRLKERFRVKCGSAKSVASNAD